jgi:hypothetical protein
MRSRMCNGCRVWSPVDDWGWGCPACGNGNGREVSYSEYPGVEILPDIQPYRSMLDGTIVESRSRHRQHMKKYNAVEVGNETAVLLKPPRIPDTAPQQRRELLRAQFDAIDNKQFKAFIKRDIDRVKWNSRED